MNYADQALSLLVPITIIIMVVATKRVALSLFSGIVVGGILMKWPDGVMGVASYIYHAVANTIYSYSATEGFSLNIWNLEVFGFLFILGVITQLMLFNGGIEAFVIWIRRRVDSARGAEGVAFLAGIIIFIDDYFNALTAGQVSKNIIDATGSTRERLAYIIDSTSAPVCVLVPISSWGAYTLGLLNNHSLGEPLDVLLGSLVYNFYAWLTLICVGLVIFWQVNFGPMRECVPREAIHIDDSEGSGGVYMLLVPIASLFFSILGLIFYTGYAATGSTDIFAMLKETDTAVALFGGGCISLVITCIISYKSLMREPMAIVRVMIEGVKIMGGAILILALAWSIGPVIRDDIQTGVYLAHVSQTFLGDSSTVLVPMVIFICSGIIGFSTGTSWGTFAIMIPIVVNITAALGLPYEFILMSIAAVLAGAVYGDHISPISDTTILSATGAECDVHAHFITQLPYATLVAGISCVAYIICAWSGSAALAYVVCALALAGILYTRRARSHAALMQGVA